jgi:hypothetical protein
LFTVKVPPLVPMKVNRTVEAALGDMARAKANDIREPGVEGTVWAGLLPAPAAAPGAVPALVVELSTTGGPKETWEHNHQPQGVRDVHVGARREPPRASTVSANTC